MHIHAVNMMKKIGFSRLVLFCFYPLRNFLMLIV